MCYVQVLNAFQPVTKMGFFKPPSVMHWYYFGNAEQSRRPTTLCMKALHSLLEDAVIPGRKTQRTIFVGGKGGGKWMTKDYSVDRN